MRGVPCDKNVVGWKTLRSGYPQMMRGFQRTGSLQTDQGYGETTGSPTNREVHGDRAAAVPKCLG